MGCFIRFAVGGTSGWYASYTYAPELPLPFELSVALSVLIGVFLAMDGGGCFDEII